MDEQEAKRHEEAYRRARAKLWQAFAAYQEWQDDTGDEATFASWAKEEIPALTRPGPRDPVTYGHRNLLHCKAVGALAGAEAALQRARATKRSPRWLVECLEGIVERARPVANEMAKHRDEAW